MREVVHARKVAQQYGHLVSANSFANTVSSGETVCSYMATLSHGAEFRGRQRPCTQSMFGATVGPAVGCEVKG